MEISWDIFGEEVEGKYDDPQENTDPKTRKQTEIK